MNYFGLWQGGDEMTLLERKKLYLEYLKLKVAESDWHGVADCAMDLRELEVEMKMTPEYVLDAEAKCVCGQPVDAHNYYYCTVRK